MRHRPAIDKLTPGIHGGINRDELKNLGISPETVLDFSVSINPFGPPPGIREALTSTSIEHYPDSEAEELRQALADKLHISPSRLMAGSGSTELIRLIAAAYLEPDDLVIIPQPTYSEYETACYLADAQIMKQPVLKEPDFHPDTSEITNLIKKHRPKAVFLCNPNNPTGHYMSREEVSQIMSSAQESLIVLDEAYIAFTENAWASVDLIDRGNLIILRSMTKDYALAGLRLGYAIAAEPIISILKRVRPPWNVNSVAQKAGIIALNADSYIKGCYNKIRKAKNFLINELERLGLSPLPSQTNFFLVRVGNAMAFRQALLKKGILVRDCTSFGLPQYIRLAPRALPDCRKLIEAIKDSGVLSHAG
ncbi:MAG: histidinol-phosphate transaminase [Dehalococcoidia bacterium]|nr:histidinol-phosphate transaminase [Dehalococcoidia bacterium]